MIAAALLSLLAAGSANAQVTATNPNGVTNPSRPEFAPIGSYVNQTSLSRLLTLNGVDDFCLFGPPEPGPDSLIGNVEPIVVSYCTKPRNGARLIPDGTITAAHFIKTPYYVQIYGFWDGTKVNIPTGDAGGELDPHGAEAVGNPIGGNVTSNVSGQDVFYEEWMSFISYNQFCLRICTRQDGNVTTSLMCEHELDVMGCAFVMAIPDFYSSDKSFTSCDGDAAVPPGLYPLSNGSTSTFRQRYTGSYTQNGQVQFWTVGQEVTPSAPFLYPQTSNCVTYSTISNGVDTNNFLVTATPSTLTGGQTVAGQAGSTSMSRPSNMPSASASSASASRSGASGSSNAPSSPRNSGSASGTAAAQSSTGAAGTAVEFKGVGTIFVGMVAALFGVAMIL